MLQAPKETFALIAEPGIRGITDTVGIFAELVSMNGARANVNMAENVACNFGSTML
jgi:hypothetical protein